MKKKVLQIVGSLSVGGTEAVAMNIAKSLNNKGVQSDFLVFYRTNSFYENEALKLGCEIIKINPPTDGYLNYFYELKKIFNSGKYEAVHSHITLNSGIVLMIARICNIKIRISHSHFTDNGVNETVFYKFYKSIMQFAILRNATQKIACGQEAGEFLYGSNKKVRILNNAINIDKFKFDEMKRAKIRKEFDIGESLLLGHVGRLTPVKNHEFILKVLKELLILGIDCKLILVGDGEIKKEIVSKVKDWNLQQQVIFTGNRLDVSNILSAIDVFIFPSFNEGLPLTLVEAQVSNLPCLVSDTITKEIVINKNVKCISLQDDISVWANEVMSAAAFKRENTVSAELLARYSLNKFQKAVEDIYKINDN